MPRYKATNPDPNPVTGGSCVQGHRRAGWPVHAVRITAAHTDTLARTMHVVFGLFRRFWLRYIEDCGAFIRAASPHRATLSCMAAGSADGTRAATEAFLDYLGELTEAIIARTRR